MLIIPAIDLKAGRVVRLYQGKQDKETLYSQEPVKVAKKWEKEGAKLIHVVDLDGAFTGKPANLDIVKKIAKEVDIDIEFGGGIRDKESIRELLNAGIKRVVLGTRAKDISFLKEVFEEFKEKVIVSIDAKGGKVQIKGWGEASAAKDTELAKEIASLGFREIIYTDISKDGTLKGPNITSIKRLLKEVSLRVVVSGGISSLDDIIKLKKLEPDGLVGVIIGKALYEKKFTLSEALKIC